MPTHQHRAKAVSRRSVLVSAGRMVGATAVAVVTATQASAQAKVAQSAVGYQDTPKGPQQCDNCLFFEPPSSCKTVAGTISPQGWCKIYSKKPG